MIDTDSVSYELWGEIDYLSISTCRRISCFLKRFKFTIVPGRYLTFTQGDVTVKFFPNEVYLKSPGKNLFLKLGYCRTYGDDLRPMVKRLILFFS